MKKGNKKGEQKIKLKTTNKDNQYNQKLRM